VIGKLEGAGILIAIALLAALGIWVYRKGPGPAVASAVTAAVTAVGDAAAGAVTGVGTVFGIPETSSTQCQIDLANGDLLAASFSCDAGTYATALAKRMFTSIGTIATTVNPERSPGEAAAVPPGFEQYQ
jgi:hypothetical protein